MKSNIEKLSEHLRTLGFKDNVTLATTICNADHADVIDNVITGFLLEEDLPKQQRFNLINLCFSKGIVVGIDVLNFLRDYKEQGSTYFGKGEALLRLLMKGIPTKSGDFEVLGKVFEVKYEKSRLRGMLGFDYVDASGVAAELDILLGSEFPDPNHNKWNFVSAKRINTTYFFEHIVMSTGMDPVIACKLFVEAWRKGFFTRMTDDEADMLAHILSKQFHPTLHFIYQNTDSGYSDFIFNMCAFAMKYYANAEAFHGMIVLNKEFDCVYITKKFISESSLNDLSNFIKLHFNITPPSLSPKAAIQGSSFGITLKPADI